MKTTIKTKKVKKVSQSKSAQMQMTFKYCVNKTYRTISDVAKACGVKMPARRGFCFLEPETALWCIQLSGNTLWDNRISIDGSTLTERRIKDISPASFQKRIRKGKTYDVDVRRICFAKENGRYRFVGVFRISQIDYNTMTATFKRETCSLPLQVKIAVRKKVTIIVEEETEVEIKY